MNNEIKELHIWLKNDFPLNTLHDYMSIDNALKNNKLIVNTTNTYFCNTKYIINGYRIFAHMLNNECIEITLGTKNKNTNKDIKTTHNIEKLLLANEFGYAT